jgi:UDP:flavonoid glycosyltransferase YjiC (YdhE family)
VSRPTRRRLEAALAEITSNPTYRSRAQAVAGELAQENGTQRGADEIETFLTRA